MLNNEQIQKIQRFCHKEISHYYDVEIEVADHLVNEMEAAIQINPSLDFDSLFELKKLDWKKQWKEIVITQSASLKSKYLNKLKYAFLEYFTIPKISITFLLVALVVYIDKSFKVENFIKGSMHLVNIVNAFYLFKKGNIITYNRENKKLGLLTYKVIYWINISISLPILLSYFILSMTLIEETLTMHPIVYQIALYLFPLAIIVLLAWRKVYVSGHLELREKYSQAFA